MANYLDQPTVQPFVETTKLTIGEIDVALDHDCADYVLSQLTTLYDTSGWTSGSNTPRLILQIMAMRYAGILYARVFSEDINLPNSWAAWLLKQVDTMILGILNKQIVVPGIVTITDGRGPLFFPTDAQDFDGLGNETKFTMGQLF